MTAAGTVDEPLLPLGMKNRPGQTFDFQNQRQRHKHPTLQRVRVVRMRARHVRGRVRQSIVQCMIDGEEKGRDREAFRRNEEVLRVRA